MKNIIPKRTLIIGAGEAAVELLLDIKRHAECPYTVVALIDDDPKKWGNEIHGVPVLGGRSEILPCVAKHQI